MGTLGELHSRLAANISRGSSLNTIIPSYVRDAALWLERNMTYEYMKKWVEVEIDPDVQSQPRLIELGETRVKQIYTFRWVDSEGEFQDVARKQPTDYDKLEEGTPTGYWPDGTSRLVLSHTPDKVLNGELYVSRYTAWPGEDTFGQSPATNYLLEFGSDVLEARTMVALAARIRDPKLKQLWDKNLIEALTTFNSANEEFAYQNDELVQNFVQRY